jgi:signal transduction histidine kinase
MFSTILTMVERRLVSPRPRRFETVPPTPVRRSSLGTLPAAALVVSGVVAGALTAWASDTSPVLVAPDATAVLRGLVIVVYVVAGAVTWHRRAGDRFAPLMVLLGFGFAIASLVTSGDESVYTVGRLLTAAWIALYLYAFLAFPAGRLGARVERAIVGAYALAAIVVWPIVVLVAKEVPPAGPFADCGDMCPDNGLRVVNISSGAWHVPYAAVSVAAVLAAAAAAAVLVRKAWSPLAVQQRTVSPVLLAVVLVIVSFLFATLHPAGGDWRTANLVLAAIGGFFVPIAFVFGPLRGELFVSRSLWRSLSGIDYSRVSPRQAQDICRRALGDGSLQLAMTAPGVGVFHDADGVELVGPGADRLDGRDPEAVTSFERGGITYALIHDRSLGSGYRWLVERVGGLACTLIEYGRTFHDLVFSRQRIAESESEDRRQLERDLHDGAQQRLLSIRMKLADLQRTVAGSELAEPVGDLSRDAASAVEEVRRIAQGIYPAMLLERGVGDALRDLPSVPGISIQVVDDGVGRLPATTERALYFSAAEAIQNASKHSDASTIRVTFARLEVGISVVVEDDGTGFDPQAVPPGDGLTGMRDRIGSAGGELEVTSSPGSGTTVRFLVPRPRGDTDTAVRERREWAIDVW